MKNKKKTLGQRLIEGLNELTEVLKSGEPLEDHFRVTELTKDSKGKITRTVKGPKKKKNGSR
jgi:hypothetical protein